MALFLMLASVAGAPSSIEIETEVENPDIGTNHALIIGIDNYDDADDLTGPTQDAKELAAMLTSKYGFDKTNVTLLTDQTKKKPTNAVITKTLGELSEKLTGINSDDYFN